MSALAYAPSSILLFYPSTTLTTDLTGIHYQGQSALAPEIDTLIENI